MKNTHQSIRKSSAIHEEVRSESNETNLNQNEDFMNEPMEEKRKRRLSKRFSSDSIATTQSETTQNAEITNKSNNFSKKLRGIFETLMSNKQKGVQKLNSHLSAMAKADKYIRMGTSIIKTQRGFGRGQNLGDLYKQLLLTRRVIRWQSQFQTYQELFSQKLSLGEKMFKCMQLVGDFTDLAAFWMKTADKGKNNNQKTIEKLQKTQQNLYFIECVSFLCIYIFKTIKLLKSLMKQKSLSQKEKIREKVQENALKAVKYSIDCVTSYNNSSIKRVDVSPKLGGILNIFSTCISLFLMWK